MGRVWAWGRPLDAWADEGWALGGLPGLESAGAPSCVLDLSLPSFFRGMVFPIFVRCWMAIWMLISRTSPKQCSTNDDLGLLGSATALSGRLFSSFSLSPFLLSFFFLLPSFCLSVSLSVSILVRFNLLSIISPSLCHPLKRYNDSSSRWVVVVIFFSFFLLLPSSWWLLLVCCWGK